MSRPLILISNDDSVHASGLAPLIDMVSVLADIVVVAPSLPQSGMSHALTSLSPLRINKIKESTQLNIYSCSGTPVDCIKLGMSCLVPRKPDLILSGINHGSNSSISIIYSGTMAAAAEGALYGIPAIGFSLCDYSATANFSPCISYGRTIVKAILNDGSVLKSNRVALNVNFPAIPESQIKGIKVCRQHKGVWREHFDIRQDPQGENYYWLSGEYVDLEPEAKDTDESVIADGYVAVVPVHFDFTAYETINKLDKMIN